MPTRNPRKKFDEYIKEAKVLEKEINLMIKKFEKKNNVTCWISSKIEKSIHIDISADRDLL